MNIIVNKILDEIVKTKQEVFTKKEILALINELNNTTESFPLESNDVKIIPDKYLLVVNDNVYDNLPKKLFNLLYYLILNKNKNVTRTQILNNVWGDDVMVGDRTIDVHIRKLRTIVPEKYIKTTRGLGYSWVDK